LPENSFKELGIVLPAKIFFVGYRIQDFSDCSEGTRCGVRPLEMGAMKVPDFRGDSDGEQPFSVDQTTIIRGSQQLAEVTIGTTRDLVTSGL